MNKPLISIIIPCYKVEKYINRCLYSITHQTIRDIEIIVIDDGSPDSTPKLCDNWAEKDHRIKVIHKENEGLGYSRNTGIKIAKGEYIAFVDSDDFVELNMYELLLSNAKKYNSDAVFCGIQREKKDGSWKIDLDFKTEKVFENEEIKFFNLGMIAGAPYTQKERPYSMSVWHAIYNKSIIDKHNIRFVSEREVSAEDLPFQCDFLLKARRITYIPAPLYHYCLNNTSLTSTFIPDKFRRYKQLRSLLLNKLGDNKETQDRINRMFIGYVRSFISKMYISNYHLKKQMLNTIIKDKIWEDLRKHYSPNYLPFYSQIHYRLILYRSVHLLKIITITNNLLKYRLKN